MEIERKYLVKQQPIELSKYRHKKIEQGYLCHNPIIRIRKSDEDYILTYKSKFGLKPEGPEGPVVNNEVELPLTREAYLTLRGKTEGNMIYKTRYLIPLSQGLIAELDIFEDKLQGLEIVEVEFPDLQSANAFIPPSWFGRDMSADIRYTNYHLSRVNRLEELVMQ
jgi:adenylate cyclase